MCDAFNISTCSALYPEQESVLNVVTTPYLNILCIGLEKPYYTKTPINLSTTFNYCTQFPENSQSTVIMYINRSTGIQHVYCVP